jgi:hypothetical protein
MNAQPESPWWGDSSLDWTRGDLGVLLKILATAYPDWIAITEITQAAGLDFQPEPDTTTAATSIWTRILRKAANERRLLALMAKVLDDQSGRKSYLRIARQLDSLITPPTNPGQEASGGLESIASGEPGPIEAGAYIQAKFDLTWCTAAIMVDGLICGAGCRSKKTSCLRPLTLLVPVSPCRHGRDLSWLCSISFIVKGLAAPIQESGSSSRVLSVIVLPLMPKRTKERVKTGMHLPISLISRFCNSRQRTCGRPTCRCGQAGTSAPPR